MKKILFLSSLGGILEFYDFIIFIFFVAIINKVFYPATDDSFWGLIGVYSTFAVGYFARPLGGIIMAHFGDKKGRKNVFLLSVLLMVIPTFVLGVLPGFESIGYFAPLILVIIRILQGVAVGGELPGAWVYVSEHFGKNKLGFAIGVLTASVTGGIFVGGFVTLLLYIVFSEEQINSWAFRIPFLLGGVFGIFSIYLRKMLSESPEFLAIQKSNGSILPIKEMLKFSKIDIFVGMMLTWILTGCIVVLVLLMPNFMESILKLSHFERLDVQIFAVFFTSLSCIFVGICVDRYGLIKSLMAFFVFFILSNGVYFYVLSQVNPNAQIVLATYLLATFANGVMVFCPLAMVLLYPVYYRFSALSFAYNIGYAIFGGIAPIVATFFMQKNIMGLGYYMMFLGILGIVMGMYLKLQIKKR
ncbi:MFS transporter [Helicobacter sp. faydin-H20]|uniref:MFS transporter n=1 Tax=Helicobacter anatolicus TaxID=2905874 RepID=UPI001E51809D|nr:MFS transporter [Helicobacter anatolicus]MCE3036763.1 MFS transporter [Helicobacter anatolicus]